MAYAISIGMHMTTRKKLSLILNNIIKPNKYLLPLNFLKIQAPIKICMSSEEIRNPPYINEAFFVYIEIIPESFNLNFVKLHSLVDASIFEKYSSAKDEHAKNVWII